MGMYGDTSQPPTPVYNDSYREGVQAEINAIPDRLAAEAAAREGGQYVRGPNGQLTRYVPPTEPPAGFREAWQGSVEGGDDRDFRTWLTDHAATMEPKDPNLVAVQEYLSTSDVPQGELIDFGGGDAGRAALDIQTNTQLMDAGADAAVRYEQQRLQNELNLLPEFNNLNIDMQQRTYDAANNALDSSERQRLTREQELRPQFTQLELDAQRAAWEQSMDQGEAATRRQTALQTELMPGINQLGLDNQSAAYRQGLDLTTESARRQNALFDELDLNGQALNDQQRAFQQSLAQNAQGAAQAAGLQAQLLPLLNSLGISMQGQANDASRRDATLNATQQAELQAQLLPMLNSLGLNLQGDATRQNQAADGRAFQQNLGQSTDAAGRAFNLSQLFNPEMSAQQVGNAAAANAQSRQDATLSAQEMQRLQEQFNASTQRMAMSNQGEANARSRTDSEAAYRQGMGLQNELMPALNRQNLAAQEEADRMGLARSSDAVRQSAALSREVMPGINATNLAAQRQADQLGQDQSAAAMRRSASLQQELMPGLNQMGLENQQAGRRAALESVKETDATRYNTREALGQQVMADVALGDQLSDAQRYRLQNSIRSSQAARGNILGGAPAVEEAMMESDYGDRLKQQRQSAALNFVNSNDLLPQFQTMQGNDPTAGFDVNRQFSAAQISDPTQGLNVNRQFNATQGQNLSSLFNPQSGYQGAGVGNAAQGYNAQTGVAAYSSADPMSAFNVNANTTQGGNSTAVGVGNSAALFNPQATYGAMGVNNGINQVGPNSTGATRANPQSMFSGANLSAAQPVNTLMPNFSAGSYNPTAPNFQATTTSGPNLSPTPISQSGAFQFTTNGAGQAGVQSANSNWGTLSNINAQNRQNMTGAIGSGIGSLAGMFM